MFTKRIHIKRSYRRTYSSVRKRDFLWDHVKRVLKAIFVSLFMFIFITGGYYAYYQAITSPYFQISRFEIKGLDVLKNNEIKKILGPVIGNNIFLVNTKIIIDRLENNPWIKTADVNKKYPNNLLINIKERAPFAIIETSAGEKFLIDRNGFLIKKITDQGYKTLPTIHSMNATGYRIANKLKAPEIKNGLNVIEKISKPIGPNPIVNLTQLNKADSKKELTAKENNKGSSKQPSATRLLTGFTSISIEGEDRFTLKTSSADIRLSEKKIRENLNKLNVALKIIQKEGLKIKSIDLTFKDQVVLKLL